MNEVKELNHRGSGWYMLSDGTMIRGKENAEKKLEEMQSRVLPTDLPGDIGLAANGKHLFVGRSDRWCEKCNRPDRDSVHDVFDSKAGKLLPDFEPEKVPFEGVERKPTFDHQFFNAGETTITISGIDFAPGDDITVPIKEKKKRRFLDGGHIKERETK